MRETWYVLENGFLADPADVSAGDDGRLVNEAGVKVALRTSGVPLSYGVDDADAERAAQKKGKGSQPFAPLGDEPAPATDDGDEGEGDADDADGDDEGSEDDVNEGENDGADQANDTADDQNAPPRKTAEAAADKRKAKNKIKTRGDKAE